MDLDPASVLRYRLAVNHLSGSLLPPSALAEAARPGLQDGSPWSGLLSLHLRVAGVSSDSWRHPSLAQVFGPRGAVYLVPRPDIAVFTLGVFPTDERHAAEVRTHADAVRSLIGGEPMSQRDIVRLIPALGGTRGLRWAGTTGTLLPVWDTVDTIVTSAPAPTIDMATARRELARRFFRHLGPASVDDLRWWLDTTKRPAADLVAELGAELIQVSSEGGARFITADAFAVFADPPEPPDVLLLPPDDVVINRRTARLLVEPAVATEVWPKAPPPGAVIADGRIVGTWRRQHRSVTIRTWVELTSHQADRAAAIVGAFPLPGGDEPATSFERV